MVKESAGERMQCHIDQNPPGKNVHNVITIRLSPRMSTKYNNLNPSDQIYRSESVVKDTGRHI